MLAGEPESERERERESRETLELMLAEVVVALRRYCGGGNLTFRIPQTGDFVAILTIDDVEAADLAKLLGANR
jgi:hypothetical protein